MRTDRNTPPTYLEGPESDLFAAMVTEYGIDDAGGLALLTAACENHARARRCREIIDVDGELVGGKPHPLCAIERDSRKGFVATIKALGLDVESAGASGGAGHGNRTLRRIA